jgi:hypothetical protein
MTSKDSSENEAIKEKIRQIFNKNVKNKKPDVSDKNEGHDGKYGHWVEAAMGIKANNKNKPDLFGFELKNNTTSKTSFGDWQSNDSIFQRKSKMFLIDRERFLEIFGKPNIEKGGRYSWSGEPFPKVGRVNNFGQWMEIDSNNNVLAMYSFSKDQRSDKRAVVPKDFQKDNLLIAIWYAEKLKEKLERKFNQRGWFTLIQNEQGYYTEIAFGKPITFDVWISWVKKGDVFLDSGMHQVNKRPYANWRANNSFMEELLTRPD